MSLCRIAWRLVCVEALKGRTLVGENVLDSEIGALDLDAHGHLQTDKSKPFLAVYTDQAEAVSGDVRALYENGVTVLRIEMGVTEGMVIQEEVPGEPGTYIESVVAGIPHTTGSFELALDLLARQVIGALADPNNPFAEAFRDLVGRISKVERMRTSGGRDGQRIAAQQIAITADLLPDPITEADTPADGAFAKCLALFDAAGGDLASTAALLRAELKPAGADWADLQERLGLTGAELASLGSGPVDGDDDAATPEITEATLDVASHGSETVT